MIRGRRAPLIFPLRGDHPAGAASLGAGTPPDFASAAFLLREYAAYGVARAWGETAMAWHHLERAHVVAQPLAVEHLRSHAIMLRYAINSKDWREAGGQILRFGLALIGNLVGHLPAGKTGRARISAFSPMPVRPDLEIFVQGVRP